MDAISPPVENHIKNLSDAIRHLIAGDTQKAARAVASSAATSDKARAKSKFAWIVPTAVALVMGAAAIGAVVFHKEIRRAIGKGSSLADPAELVMLRSTTAPGTVRLYPGENAPNFDLSAFRDKIDLVQIRVVPGEKPALIGLDAKGNVVAGGEGLADDDRNLRWISDSHGNVANLVYLTQFGGALPAHPGGLDIGPIPKVNRPVADVVTGPESGILILDSSRAVPWGTRYDPAKPNSWRAPPESSLQNVLAAVITAEIEAVLHEDGSVTAWNAQGPLELPSQFRSGIRLLARNGQHILAADQKGRLWQLETLSARQVADGVTALESGDHALYRNEDGSWHFVSLDLPGEIPTFVDALSRLHGLPPEAFHIHAGSGESHDGRYIAWIKPGHPALGARNNRPGRLRYIVEGDVDEAGFAEAMRPFQDLTDIVQFRGRLAQEEIESNLVVLRTSGETVTNTPKLVATEGISALTSNLSVYLTDDGEAIAGTSTLDHLVGGPVPAASRPIVDVISMAHGGIALLDNGQAIAYGPMYDPDLKVSGLKSEWPKPLTRELKKVTSVALTSNYGAVGRSDGSVFAWDETGSLDLPEFFDGGVIKIFGTGYLHSMDDAGSVWRTTHPFTKPPEKRKQGVSRVFVSYNSSALLYESSETGEWQDLNGHFNEYPKIREGLGQLKGLHPDAFYAGYTYGEKTAALLMWIEPVEEKEPTPEFTAVDPGTPANSQTSVANPEPNSDSPENDLRPIPGTAGWRSEEPGEVIAFPRHPADLEKEPPSYALVPEGLGDVVALYYAKVPDTRTQHKGKVAVFAIRENGTVATWGDTDLKVVREMPSPALLQDVTSLSIWANGGIALHRDGSVTSWGAPNISNWIKEHIDRPVRAIHASHFGANVVFEDSSHKGTYFGWSTLSRPPPDLKGLVGVVGDPGGWFPVVGLRQDGGLLGWGEMNRMMAHPPKDLPPVRVIAGGCSAILENGMAVIWTGKAVPGSDPVQFETRAIPFARNAEVLAIGSENNVAAARIPGRKWAFTYQAYDENKGDPEYCAKMADGCTQLVFVHPRSGTPWWLGIRPKAVTAKQAAEPTEPLTKPGTDPSVPDLRPIPGTAGWRSEEPGRIIAFPWDNWKQLQPSSIVTNVPKDLSDAVALYLEDFGSQQVCMAIRADGSVVGWGMDCLALQMLPENLEEVAALAFRPNGGIALHRDGTVTPWGDTLQVAMMDLGDVVSIACSDHSGFHLVTADGTLHAMGKPGSPKRIKQPGDYVAVLHKPRERFAIGIRANGKVEWLGAMGSLPPVLASLPPVTAMTGRESAILQDGRTIWWNEKRPDEGFHVFAKGTKTLIGNPHMVNVAALSSDAAGRWSVPYPSGGGSPLAQDIVAQQARNCTQWVRTRSGWNLAIRPEPPEGDAEIPAEPLPELPIPGTPGWRSEEPGAIVSFPMVPTEGDPPTWARVPEDIKNAVALYGIGGGDNTRAVFALRGDGTVAIWGDPGLPVVADMPADLRNVAALSLHPTAGIALHVDGSVSFWRQAGKHHNLANVESFANSLGTGRFISVSSTENGFDLIDDTGTLFSFGHRSPYGRLSWGKVAAPAAGRWFASIKGNHQSVIGLRRDGSLGTWGEKHYHRLTAWPPDPLPPVRIISNNCSAILENGTSITWSGSQVEGADPIRYATVPTPFATGAEVLANSRQNDIVAARIAGRKWVFHGSFKDAEHCERMAEGCTQLIYMKGDRKDHSEGWWIGIRPKRDPGKSGPPP